MTNNKAIYNLNASGMLYVSDIIVCMSNVILTTDSGTFIWKKEQPDELSRHVFSLHENLLWYCAHNKSEIYIYNKMIVWCDTNRYRYKLESYYCAIVLDESTLVILNPNQGQITLWQVCHMYYKNVEFDTDPYRAHLLNRPITGVAMIDGIGYFIVGDKAVVLLNDTICYADIIDRGCDPSINIIPSGLYVFTDNKHVVSDMVCHHLIRKDVSSYQAVYAQPEYRILDIAKSHDQQILLDMVDSGIFYHEGSEKSCVPLYIDMFQANFSHGNRIHQNIVAMTRTIHCEKRISIVSPCSMQHVMDVVVNINYDRIMIPSITLVDSEYQLISSSTYVTRQLICDIKMAISDILANIDSDEYDNISFYQLGIFIYIMLVCDDMPIYNASSYVYKDYLSPSFYSWYCVTHNIALHSVIHTSSVMTKAHVEHHITANMTSKARSRYDRLIEGMHRRNDMKSEQGFSIFHPELLHNMLCLKPPMCQIEYVWENEPDNVTKQKVIDIFDAFINRDRLSFARNVACRVVSDMTITIFIEPIRSRIVDYIVDTCNRIIIINASLSIEAYGLVLLSLVSNDPIFHS